MTDPINLAKPTVNKTGYSKQIIDKIYSQAFIDYLEQLSMPHVLEIGPGYGAATALALSAGAVVTAADLEVQHLKVLKKNIPTNLLERLTLKVGKFPQDLDFPTEAFEAILMSQVLHFLTSDEIEQGLPLLFKWLKPRGKICITAISPYMGVLRDFFPIYQQRKSQGQPWPGQIENLKTYCTHPCSDLNPNFIHVFDPDILKYHFTQVGFEIEKVGFYPTRQNLDVEFKNNGLECVGIIAVKPA